jgi:hypothetical protein
MTKTWGKLSLVSLISTSLSPLKSAPFFQATSHSPVRSQLRCPALPKTRPLHFPKFYADHSVTCPCWSVSPKLLTAVRAGTLHPSCVLGTMHRVCTEQATSATLMCPRTQLWLYVLTSIAILPSLRQSYCRHFSKLPSLKPPHCSSHTTILVPSSGTTAHYLFWWQH